MNSIAALLVTTVSIVQADLAVYCVNKETQKGSWGALDFYEFAADSYDCSVAEVLCLKLKDDATLKAEIAAYEAVLDKAEKDAEAAAELADNETSPVSDTTDDAAANTSAPIPPPTDVVEEPPKFVLESDAVSYATKCTAISGCLCNINEG